MRSFRLFLTILPFALLAAPLSAHAQSGGMLGGTGAGLLNFSSGALQLVVPAPVVVPPPAVPAKTLGTVTWIDAGRLADTLRIAKPVADLRAVTTDPSGKNVGFYYVSAREKTFAVYRNGRLMQGGDLETLADHQKPLIFRMTASGDLLYALHGTDLYVNATPVSLDRTSFPSIESVQEGGGVLTFAEGGSVISYDIARNTRKTLHRHSGTIESLRREGDTVAYVLRERTGRRMYRDGRRVSARVVENAQNFALSREGDIYFFTKAPRGYALYRNTRSFVIGKGAGAFVGIDPKGRVWHVSYTRLDNRNTVRLQRDRSAKNLLPANIENLELDMAYPDGGYALRAAFFQNPSAFSLVRDGKTLGRSFAFDFPFNDTNGLLVWDGAVVLRVHDGDHWRISVDGEILSNSSLKEAFYARVDGSELIIYATK